MILRKPEGKGTEPFSWPWL